MRQHDLHSQAVDWTAVRDEAFKRAGGAFNPIDTYPAIYWALVQLNDPGSHLRLPPGLFPDQIALLETAEKEAAHSAPSNPQAVSSLPSAFATRRLPEGHIVTAHRAKILVTSYCLAARQKTTTACCCMPPTCAAY